MTGDAGLTAHHDKISQLATAGNTHLRSNQATSANVNVMCYLAEIINLCACTNNGVGSSPPIDAGIGAHFHIVFDNYGAKLRNFFMIWRARRKPKSVLPNAYTRVHDYV